MNRTYEPPLTEVGIEMSLWNPPEIFPGVIGYAVETEGLIYIPMIKGKGEGKVSEIIDKLSYRCRIVNIVSSKLKSMLLRHGWRPEFKDIDGGGDVVDVWSYVVWKITWMGYCQGRRIFSRSCNRIEIKEEV